MHRSFRKEKKLSLPHHSLGAEIRTHGRVSKAVSQDIWHHLNEFSSIQSQIPVIELDLPAHSSLISTIIRVCKIEICNQNAIVLIYKEKGNCFWRDGTAWPAQSKQEGALRARVQSRMPGGRCVVKNVVPKGLDTCVLYPPELPLEGVESEPASPAWNQSRRNRWRFEN